MLIKLPFIQYLYGIRSMRQTVKEIEVNVELSASLKKLYTVFGRIIFIDINICK